MTCNDCKYPYVPMSGHCPNCGADNSLGPVASAIIMGLVLSPILPLLLLILAIFVTRPQRFLIGWILIAYLIYLSIDTYNSWFFSDMLKNISKEFLYANFIVSIIGVVFGLIWVIRGTGFNDPIESVSSTTASITQAKAKKTKSLQDLKKAKELLDLGAISQDEFNSIKSEALSHATGTKSKDSKKGFNWTLVLVIALVSIGAYFGINALRTKREYVDPMLKYQAQENPKPLESERSTQPADNVNEADNALTVLDSSRYSYQADEATNSLVVPDDSKYSHEVDFTKRYKGSINNKYEIDLTLTKEGTRLTGSYFYTVNNAVLTLEGSIESDGSFSLEEVSSGNVTGKFTGRLTGSSASGTWSNPSGGKVMPFQVNESN